MTEHVPLGSGADAIVSLDSALGVVHKRYRPRTDGRTGDLVRHEYERLEQFSRALADEPFVSCPEPKSVDPGKGIVSMSYCAGIRLDHFLETSTPQDLSHILHISEQICIATRLFVSTFQEPYDLAPSNLIYDHLSGVLHLIDVARAPEFVLRTFADLPDPFSISIGAFIGGSTAYTVELRKLRTRAFLSNQQALCARLLLYGVEENILLATVKSASIRTLAFYQGYGRTFRRIWFKTYGKLLHRHRLHQIYSTFEQFRQSHVEATSVKTVR